MIACCSNIVFLLPFARLRVGSRQILFPVSFIGPLPAHPVCSTILDAIKKSPAPFDDN